MNNKPVISRSPEEKEEYASKYLKFIKDKSDRIDAIRHDKGMDIDLKLRIMVEIINERFYE